MLTRSLQIGFRLETDEGVSEKAEFVAADFTRTITDASYTGMGHPYERNEKKAGLSKSSTLMGAVLQGAKWTEEMAGGSATLASAARWHDLLQACGFAPPIQLKKIAYGAVTGTPFVVGERIGDNATEGSATAKGIIVALETSLATTYIVYEVTAGTFSTSGSVYGYTGSGHASVTENPSNAGQRQKLLSETDSTICKSGTMEIRNGGQIHRGIGCRGNAVFAIKHNEPLKINFDFRGVKDFDGFGAVETGSLMASVPAAAKPFMVGKRAFPVLLDTYSPVMTQLNIDLQNQLADRPTIGEAGITISSGEKVGYGATRIGDRNIQADIDPEHVAAATFDFYNHWTDETLFKLYAAFGKATDSVNGKIVFSGPKTQFTAAEWTPGDRDGLIIHQPKLKFTGDADDELVIDHIFV